MKTGRPILMWAVSTAIRQLIQMAPGQFLKHPVRGRLFFAGEATIEGYFATVDGAMESGHEPLDRSCQPVVIDDSFLLTDTKHLHPVAKSGGFYSQPFSSTFRSLDPPLSVVKSGDQVGLFQFTDLGICNEAI